MQPMLPPSPELLTRYLAGQCADEEIRQVEAWYDAFDHHPTLSAAAPETSLTAYQQAQLAHLTARLQRNESQVIPLRPTRRLWRVVMVACVVVPLVVGGIWYARSLSAPRAVVATRVPEAFSFTNRQARIVAYALPDGSTVWLRPGARITHACPFTGPTRQVVFSGEGFFSVQQDARHPFVIRSGPMTTEVLGTSFNVRAVPNAAHYQVAVVTGKVAVTVQSVAQKVVLAPDQLAEVNLRTAKVAATSKTPRARRASYEPVSMRFDWTPLDEVARRLEAVYDVRIRLDTPALRRCRLRADFIDQSLPVILDLIGKSTSTTYALDGQQITLVGAGCPE